VGMRKSTNLFPFDQERFIIPASLKMFPILVSIALNNKVFANLLQIVSDAHLIKPSPGGSASFGKDLNIWEFIGKVQRGECDGGQDFVAISVVCSSRVVKPIEFFVPVTKSEVEEIIFDLGVDHSFFYAAPWTFAKELKRVVSGIRFDRVLSMFHMADMQPQNYIFETSSSV
jgi:hypothetical protein